MKKFILALVMLMGVCFCCGCNGSDGMDSANLDDDYDDYSEEDPIYSYDFSGYYYETGWIDDDNQDERYKEAVNLRNGDYNKEDLDFDFQLVDNYNADFNDERYTVEIDPDNYQMRFISTYGDIEYFDIVWSEECNDFIFLRTYSSGGNPWYYATKAAKID